VELNLKSLFRRLRLRVDGKQGPRRFASKVGDDLVEIADMMLCALKGQARAVEQVGAHQRVAFLGFADFSAVNKRRMTSL
jgi:hypothetical protein